MKIDNRHAWADRPAARHATHRVRNVLPAVLGAVLVLALAVALALLLSAVLTPAQAAPRVPSTSCGSLELPPNVTPKPRMTSTVRPTIPSPPAPR